MKADAVQFYCYAPRPRHADLPAMESAVLHVLKDARGVFINLGLTTSMICGVLGGHGGGVSEGRVASACRALVDGGFAEEVPMRPGRWRAKR